MYWLRKRLYKEMEIKVLTMHAMGYSCAILYKTGVHQGGRRRLKSEISEIH